MMAEYRIVAKVDPQTAQGTAKVKQDLRGIQTEAKATEASLNRSFDQARFDKSIGGLVARLNQLDKSVSGLASSNSTLAKSNENLGQTLDRLATSGGRAAKAAADQDKAARGAAGSQSSLEAALRRVLLATDAQAAEQQRLNLLIGDAKRLLDAGKISQEQYARVQALAAQSGRELNAVTGSQRIGMQQLGFQLGDVATMYSLGVRPAQIFASQIGQVSQALMLMGGTGGTSMLGRVAGFLSGPWGIAVTLATVILGPLAFKLFETNDALGESVEKLKADAKETALAAKAKEAFGKTIEGLTIAIREQNKELKESIETQRDSLLQGMTLSRQRLIMLESERDAARRTLDDEKARYDIEKQRARGSGPGAEAAALGLSDALQRVEDARKRYNDLSLTVAEAEQAIRRADAAFSQNAAERAIDPIKRLNDEYDQQRKDIIEAAVASDKFSAPALARELTLLEERRKRAIAAAQAQERLNKTVSDGTAVFRSRQQAIGIAGRELQAQGLDVSGNSQFRYTSGHGDNADHNKFAIDVNSSATPGRSTGGINESSVPNLRAKFDSLARVYQARGFNVLWNGKVWPAGGNGPGGDIKGADKHYDHLHIYAPETIVGKPTGSGTATQIARDDAARDRVQERAEDFVQAIVNRQASTGIAADSQTQLNAQIDEALAEFERKFERQATAGERATIQKAFTDAEARQVALRFDQAYVQPLARLQALQGKTGVEREILNAQLEESIQIGRALTPVELARIENGIRGNDTLSRQHEILQQIRGPLEEYRATLEALNALLASGAINQTAYNARVAELGQNATSAALGGLSGVDPKSGRTYEDISAIAEENARYAKQLEDLQAHREQLLKMGIDYDAAEEAARQEHAKRLADIDQARKDQQIGAAQEIFGSLTSIAADTVGKQSAIYKALFAMEKAVAIARSVMAIQTGIAQAAAVPFPANLGAMASVIAATASIVSNIKAVSLAFADGGYVQGPGGPRSDSIPARLSNGEFVVNARSTAANRSLLEAINAGRAPATPRSLNGGTVRPRITVNNYAGQPVAVQENITTGDVEVIVGRALDARGPDLVRRHAPRAVAADLANPNGPVQKGLRHHTTTSARKV